MTQDKRQIQNDRTGGRHLKFWRQSVFSKNIFLNVLLALRLITAVLVFLTGLFCLSFGLLLSLGLGIPRFVMPRILCGILSLISGITATVYVFSNSFVGFYCLFVAETSG